MRRRWRDPSYRRWFWRERVSRATIAALVTTAIALAGYAGAQALDSTPTAVFFTTERLMTVVRKIDGRTETQVLTQTETGVTTETGPTQWVTVMRDGKEVLVRVPGKTVTTFETVDGKVVTHVRTETDVRTRTQTNTQTETVDRPTTVRETVTHQETADPGVRTVTDTETQTETETEIKTETETETETETVTVTETVEPPPP